MSKRSRAAIWVISLSITCGLIIWHTIRWHSTAMYLEMFHWIGTDKAYITVFYNLGLMLLVGAILGWLMVKITDILDYEIREIKHFSDNVRDGGR